jgi:hypothetical protein
MVCVIIDANLAFRIFTSEPEADFRPVFDWLYASDKDGCLVFGGKLSEELANRKDSLRYLRALFQAGRAFQIPHTIVQSGVQEQIRSGLCRSNDPHVVSLARVSGARILCSDDRNLWRDFRNPKLISKPRGRIYRNATHTDLLHHDPCCPRGNQERRRRRP